MASTAKEVIKTETVGDRAFALARAFAAEDCSRLELTFEAFCAGLVAALEGATTSG
jgi:hypothetical protein